MIDTRDGFFAGLMALAAVAATGDLADDLIHGADVLHLAGEASMLLAAGVFFARMVRERHRDAREIDRLRRELAEVRLPAAADNESVRAGRRQLGEFINGQFAAWGLSESEREVGWLLLKGLSLREIAGLRQTAEKTVRTQASSLYQKAGLDGRHAFAAWFLEDLLSD
ncbi:MAG: DNA-binding response regulator [Gammaproteobacteria bacterium]